MGLGIDEKTIEMFRMDELIYSVEERIDMALTAILSVFASGMPIICAYSGGKDSSVVVALTLHAALRARESGLSPLVIVTTGDTMVENPEITSHYRSEMAKMRKFASKQGIELLTKVVQPNMLSTWQLKVLTGRGLPSFPGNNGDCSVDLKIIPQQSFRRRLFKDLSKRAVKEPVTMLGTRLDESERRALMMKARQDRADVPVRNKDGELVMTPLKNWDEDAVWEAIALYSSGVYPSFSDFEETKRIYAHAAGTSCAVVADAIYEGGEKKRIGKCGARHGCFVCQMAEDKSLANMIAFDERYSYARGLNRFNRFIRNTQYDWSLRNWIGRTIAGGYICIEPDTYHPTMLRTLGQFMLQLDYDEEMRARSVGEQPKFRLLPIDMMIAVDAHQSLQGVSRPFALWADYRDIWSGNVRYDIPEIDPVKKTPMPAARFLYVGNEWDTTAQSDGWTGLRDPLIEALTQDSGCEPQRRRLKNGRVVWDMEKTDIFSVDPESAFMIEEFEMDRLVEKYESGFQPGGITAAYMWYFQFGCLNLSAALQVKHDDICRRTSYKDRLGLTLEYELDDLLAQTISFRDLPESARAAWAHKATTDSAQIELSLA